MPRHPLRPLFRILTLTLALTLLPAGSASAQTSERCFPETGFCIAGRIREFWEQNGGLPVFGFPIAPQQESSIEGKPFQIQWFERNRLELHPENAHPYDVLLGRLGADRLAQQGRDPFIFPKSEAQAGCRFFPETGHNLCGDILAAWRASGLEFDGKRGKSEAENLALFGLPLSDAQTETIEGKTYTVQWFERARFELHPENAPPYNVLLGLLGNEVHSFVPAPATPALTYGENQWELKVELLDRSQTNTLKITFLPRTGTSLFDLMAPSATDFLAQVYVIDSLATRYPTAGHFDVSFVEPKPVTLYFEDIPKDRHGLRLSFRDAPPVDLGQ
jgi:hypothetical protein